MTTTSTAIERSNPESNRSTLAVSANQEFWNPQQIAALRQIGIQDAPNADLAVFLNFAQRTGLDPFARQIYMIGRREKRGDSWGTKWTIQASIDGLRIVAERSGDYAGQVGPEYCGLDGVWRDVWVGSEPPVASRVGVLRHGFNVPLYAVAYYEEYVQTREGKPTSMWATKPKLMLAKCAEALALRKAFPNDLAGLYTADEMGASDNKPTAPPAGDPWTRPAIAPTPVNTTTGEIIEEAQIVTQDQTEPADASPHAATAPQLKAIAALLKKCGIETQQDRHDMVSVLTNRPYADDLTKTEASNVISTLKTVVDDTDNPAESLAQLVANPVAFLASLTETAY